MVKSCWGATLPADQPHTAHFLRLPHPQHPAHLLRKMASSCTVGFPRIGRNRELKFALEKHWRNRGADLDEAGMLAVAHDVEQQAWGIQMDAGVGLISAGDHCLYDNMLAW